jgi:hypothetical protein
MSKLDLTEQHTRERAGFAARVPISISRDDTRLCADAQIDDDGPKMETYHESPYRCSRVGHADCRPDVRSPRERGPSVPGQLIIRV